MPPSPYRVLSAALDHAVLTGLLIDPARRRVVLHLGEAEAGPVRRGDGTFTLHGVSRITAWLREIDYGRNPRGDDVHPAQEVSDLADLTGWLPCWAGQRVSGELSEPGAEPDWLGWASLDEDWGSGQAEVHALDLWLDENDAAGARRLDLRVEFGGLTLGREGQAAAGRPVRGSRMDERGHRQHGGSRGKEHGASRTRRGVAMGLAAVLVAGISATWLVTHQGAGAAAGDPVGGGGHRAAGAHHLAAAESGLLPWHLAAPLSREVVMPGRHGRLIVIGGLTSGGGSANGIYSVGMVAGASRQIGTLPVAVHDAAAGVLGARGFVFGGGSSASVAAVQSFGVGGGRASAAGQLPSPRSDAAAVTIGSTAYIVGGYDGAKPDATVLATPDGRSFTKVATLPVPVRYPAVAALGTQIFVFGGQAVTGPHAGAPVSVIQVVDTARHTASIIGRLPEPLAGAAAMTLHGEVFLAGGQSTVQQRPPRGVGITQLPRSEMSAGGAAAPGTSTVNTIWAFDPASRRLLPAGHLQVGVSHAGVAVTGSTAWIVGGETGGSLVAAVQMLRPNPAFGTAGAPGAGSPYFGAKLLIADRGNNRLLLLNAAMHVVWKYPSVHAPADPLHFYFPDDAFFVDHGTAILSNQEQNNTIIKIAFPSGKIIWSYGHPRHAGTAPGYLYEPDDAYQLKNGQITVADANNCRVLVINPNHTIAHQIGTTRVCQHNPPHSLGSPNGDTPLANGNLLISEINGSWVSEYTMGGKLVWTTQLPIAYPSDPQQLGPNRYLIADYSSPGEVLQFNRAGRILYRYHPSSGPGALNHPSLSEVLPSGVIMVNDDYNDRMVAIDPVTGALVWQYGVTGRHGRAPGMLNTPDGFDILLPNGTTPTHRATG